MTDFSWKNVPREARATIAQENHRRARLYDAIWQIAYLKRGLHLFVGGGHDTVYHGTTGDGSGADGPMDHIEKWLMDKARGDTVTVDTGPDTWRCAGDPIECGYEAELGETEAFLERVMENLRLQRQIDSLDDETRTRVVVDGYALFDEWYARRGYDLRP